MTAQLQLRITGAVTDVERRLLAELHDLGEKGRALGDWEACFIDDLHHRVQDPEESVLSHKQRFYLWRTARDQYASLKDPGLQEMVEQILPIWEAAYNVGSRSR